MRISVSAWDPGYADTGESTTRDSQAQLNLDLEVPAASWEPIDVNTVAQPGRVLLVDGVRRLDARIDVAADNAPPQPGICASYAAGVVECQLGGHGVTPNAAVTGIRVERGMFAGIDAASLPSEPVGGYTAHAVKATDPGDLLGAVQERLTGLEVDVASGAEMSGDDLLVIDGALRRRTHLSRAVGYIKSHQRRYLPDSLISIMDDLRPGQRTPVFELGTSWQRHTWYVRLPGGGHGSWAGIARLEAAAELDAAEVIALADGATAVLPRLASPPHKDARAPQNLTPIAGLERRLRSRLGDPRLLLRGLQSTAAQRR